MRADSLTTTFALNLLMLALSGFLVLAGLYAACALVQDIRRTRRFVRALERATGMKL